MKARPPMFHVNPREVSECPRNDLQTVNRSHGHDPVAGRSCALTIDRKVRHLGVVGLPPIQLLPWWQVIIGLLGAPAMVTLVQLDRLAFTRDRLV